MDRRLTFLAALTAALITTTLAAPRAASAAGPAPRLGVSPTALTFTGEGKGTAKITIRNTGDAPLVIEGITVNEDGAQLKAVRHVVFAASPASGTIAPGQALDVQVTYEPAPGQKQKQLKGSLTIRSNAGAKGVRLAWTADSWRSWLLPLMTFFPLVGILFILLVPRGRESAVKWIALGASAVPFLLGIVLYMNFDRTLGVSDGGWGLQFVSHVVWIPKFNIEFFMGTDGISVLMLLLTGLVGVIACVSSFTIEKHVRGYFAMYLLLLVGMFGTFAALDFFLFYVFWEVMLLPMYFLIGIWGGPRKEYAAIKFFLYTLAGSVLMLLAIIALYYTSGTKGVGAPFTLVDGTPAAHTFDMMKLTYLNNWQAAPLLIGMKFTYVVWVALFIGFAIKVPMFPFHTWLPDAHVEAPTAISVILAGVLLKMGTYGMFRMNFAMLPDATDWARTTLAVFGVINILYGAFCAFAQTDLKKLVAYSSVSHMGYCLLGMAALNQTGMTGAMMQMFNHGTITSMLFLLVGVIYDRAHTRGVNEFGGVASVMPRYSAFFGLAFMASLGLPGLSGFIGEALVFLGAFNIYRIMTILAVTGVIVTAAYHLWAMQRIHLGPFREKWRDVLERDMDARETAMLVPLAIIVIVLGFYPKPAIDLMATGLADLARQLDAVQTASVVKAVPAFVIGGGP